MAQTHRFQHTDTTTLIINGGVKIVVPLVSLFSMTFKHWFWTNQKSYSEHIFYSIPIDRTCYVPSGWPIKRKAIKFKIATSEEKKEKKKEKTTKKTFTHSCIIRSCGKGISTGVKPHTVDVSLMPLKHLYTLSSPHVPHHGHFVTPLWQTQISITTGQSSFLPHPTQTSACTLQSSCPTPWPLCHTPVTATDINQDRTQTSTRTWHRHQPG